MNKVKCKLSELVEVKNGSTPSTAREDFYEGDIVWITPKDLSNNKSKYVYSSERRITKAGFDSCSTSLLPIGSVLLSSRAPIGLLAICAIETCTNQGFKNLVIKKNKINNEYLYYWLKTKVKYIDSLGTGTTFKEVSKGVIENLEIELPENIKDQQKIASVLSALDSKIELNNRINAELEAMAKTLYDYWFVQFDFPDKNGKPYKTSGGKMEWNEELKREIPEGWEVKSIDYYADVIDPHPSHRAPLEVLNGFPFAGIGDIDAYGNIDINKARVINEEFVLKQERDYTINEYSIGYGRVGTVGKVVKLRKQPFRFALSPTMAIINPKKSLLPSFVYFTVTNPTFFQWVNKYTSGSTRPAIGIQHLRTIPVIKPKVYTENLLEKFENIIESSFSQTDILNKENQKLTELRDWLLPMLMNGQVKVKDEKETELSMAAEPKMKYGK